MQPAVKSQLTTKQVQLVELMQRIAFGAIEDLVIRDGTPVFEPHPRVIRDVKFGCTNGPRPEADLSDFSLKSSVQELLAVISALGNATVRRLDIKHGLPFRMQVEEVAA
jgi:hypothetical protein